ncbi:hypothetical protein HPP92_013544 [Vanilla planifolia]|uniref:Uncharacterized protein n=1 Tax=Vanilla planifolia TaxID=51239 RepID=A0A835V036_VANPL|nr:hypothetical protein HPP92_013544 [Vanilla planifolia]
MDSTPESTKNPASELVSINCCTQQKFSSEKQRMLLGMELTRSEPSNPMINNEVQHIPGPAFHRLSREELQAMHNKVLRTGALVSFMEFF